MIVKRDYNKDGLKFVSEHFQVFEFASIGSDGTLYSNTVMYDTDTITMLEQLYTYLKCSSIRINSGYRTNKHEMMLKGGVKNGYHTKGMAVDINCYRDGKILTSQEICLALEDLGWLGGIGIISANAVHIDTRDKKYWFDERKGCQSIGDSFYDYFGVAKISARTKVIEKCPEFTKEFWEHIDKYEINGNNYSSDAYTKLLKYLK